MGLERGEPAFDPLYALEEEGLNVSAIPFRQSLILSTISESKLYVEARIIRETSSSEYAMFVFILLCNYYCCQFYAVLLGVFLILNKVNGL
ncbi:unannotated protein [freshwater metagenome]|uniref:Unannotated protein n=1 Tax=freshwater metagenome TaxID=449393 RepID=A0A6J6EAR3_9ZZZZ